MNDIKYANNKAMDNDSVKITKSGTLYRVYYNNEVHMIEEVVDIIEIGIHDDDFNVCLKHYSKYNGVDLRFKIDESVDLQFKIDKSYKDLKFNIDTESDTVKVYINDDEDNILDEYKGTIESIDIAVKNDVLELKITFEPNLRGYKHKLEYEYNLV